MAATVSSFRIMEFLGARIQINPRPAQPKVAALEVGLLGHCPGRVRIERLLALPRLLDDVRAAGFGSRVDAIVAGDDTSLYHLPIPLTASAEFDDIFPDARFQATQYASTLAGDTAWLPSAVDDFFANGGQVLWIVRIPEEEGARGFVPLFNHPLYDTDNLRGLSCLLVLNRVGLIGFPDLERLQIPAQLPDIPRKRLANPEPMFLPTSASINDGARERRTPEELAMETPTQPALGLLRDILSIVSKQRPDIQCVMSVPLAYSSSLDSPAADPEVLAQLNVARMQSDAYLLRQVQLLYPYLNKGTDITSAVGVVTGAIAGSAARKGAWRSIGATTLVTSARPYPAVNMQQTIALREAPGIGVLNLRQGTLQLDDERLMVPALQRDDYDPTLFAASGQYSERLNGMRSAEVVRFLGFLMRELRALGDRLVFNLDPKDPRPRFVLQDFFMNLYRAGALRGQTAAEAFTITQGAQAESTIAFDIEIAPAYPIDKIVLTFVNRQGEWVGEMRNG